MMTTAHPHHRAPRRPNTALGPSAVQQAFLDAVIRMGTLKAPVARRVVRVMDRCRPGTALKGKSL